MTHQKSKTFIQLPVELRENCPRCDNCLFGRGIVVSPAGSTACECHLGRPTTASSPFPRVRVDDYCAFHVYKDSKEQTFKKLTPDTTYITVRTNHYND